MNDRLEYRRSLGLPSDPEPEPNWHTVYLSLRNDYDEMKIRYNNLLIAFNKVCEDNEILRLKFYGPNEDSSV